MMSMAAESLGPSGGEGRADMERHAVVPPRLAPDPGRAEAGQAHPVAANGEAPPARLPGIQRKVLEVVVADVGWAASLARRVREEKTCQ